MLPVRRRCHTPRVRRRAAPLPQRLRRTVRRPLRRGRWAAREAALRWRSRAARAPAGPVTTELVVVSPHLDDAVLSCAALLAARPGGRVVTAYTAGPAAWTDLTSWDERCGFRAGVDVMAARKQEDRSALALLGAEPVWLDLVEGQYEPRPGPAQVRDRLWQHLTTLVPAPVTIAVPLGLDHPDHVTVSDALLALRAEGLLPDATWLLYEDLPYATRSPAGPTARREALRAHGLVLEPVPTPAVDLGLKRAAVARYRTQIRPLWHELPLRADQEALWRVA